MKKIVLILILSLFYTISLFSQKSYNFYVGTYTDKDSKGIYKYALSAKGKILSVKLVANSINPSFLAFDKENRILLAVNEININNSGTVELYKSDFDSLILLDTDISGGAHPCHVIFNNKGYVLISNYTGGSTGLLQFSASTNTLKFLDIEQHSGSDISPRQLAPHAHSAWFITGNQFVSADLGTNELWFSVIDAVVNRIIPLPDLRLKMEPGAGPRHIAVNPTTGILYVLNELHNSISVIKPLQGKYTVIQTISTLPKGFSAANTGAHIQLSSDNKFLYASNRGHNSIVVYKVNAENGVLQFVAHEPTLGDGPRNFAFTPDEKFMLVANQKSDLITVYKRNKNNGKITYLSKFEAPTPVCIVFE